METTDAKSAAIALPLAGVRIVDASRVLAGPFCGQILGDLGADVIKIEKPGSGDDTRGWGPPFLGEWSAYFLSCNRNKQSLALDFAAPEGSAILHRLLEDADVFIENLRTDSLPKLGLDAGHLLKRHPRLIVCSISGFGRSGPLQDVPGYDFAIQALSGLMSITGPKEGPPYKVGVALTDILTGLYAAIGILACLRAREQSGHGYAIDLALLDCAVAAQVNVAQAYLATGTVPERQGNAHLQIVPYQLFATADGWLVLNVGNDSQWQHFCTVAAVPDLAAEPRYATNRGRVENRLELIPKIEQLMRERTTSEWQKRLTENHIPHAIVANYADVFASEHIAERGMRIAVTDPTGRPVDLIGSPFHITPAPAAPTRFPPRLGENTEQILRERLGLSAEELAHLRQKKVI